MTTATLAASQLAFNDRLITEISAGTSIGKATILRVISSLTEATFRSYRSRRILPTELGAAYQPYRCIRPSDFVRFVTTPEIMAAIIKHSPEYDLGFGPKAAESALKIANWLKAHHSGCP